MRLGQAQKRRSDASSRGAAAHIDRRAVFHVVDAMGCEAQHHRLAVELARCHEKHLATFHRLDVDVGCQSFTPSLDDFKRIEAWTNRPDRVAVRVGNRLRVAEDPPAECGNGAGPRVALSSGLFPQGRIASNEAVVVNEQRGPEIYVGTAVGVIAGRNPLVRLPEWCEGLARKSNHAAVTSAAAPTASARRRIEIRFVAGVKARSRSVQPDTAGMGRPCTVQPDARSETMRTRRRPSRVMTRSAADSVVQSGASVTTYVIATNPSSS